MLRRNYTLFDTRQGRAAAFFGGIGVVVVRAGGRWRGRVGGGAGADAWHARQCRRGRCDVFVVVDGGRRWAAQRDVEGHALAVFVGVDRHHVIDRHKDLARDAAEAGVEADAVVVHLQAGRGAEADVQDDFALLDELHRHRRGAVDLDGQVWRVAAVGAPLVNGAQHVGLG